MARSTSKTILYATTRHDRKVFSHPVAVFNNDTDAKHYATYIKLALRAQDADAVKALDPKVHTSEDGSLVGETKFSVVTVPYAPSPDLGDDETDDDTPSES